MFETKKHIQTKKTIRIIILSILLILSKKIQATSLEEKLSNPETQKEAIKELWDKGEAAIPEIKEMLKNENKELREIALVRAINLQTKAFVPEVIEILEKDEEINLRKRAMQYICAIKEKSAIPKLQKKIKEAEEREKRYAIETIAYIVNPEDKENEEVKNTLKEALKDNEGQVRMEAAYQLASKFEDESGYEIAKKDIKNASALTRERAVEVLGEYGNQETMSLIEKALQDEEIWVRTKAKIAKEKLELVETIEKIRTTGTGSRETGLKKRMSRKAMMEDKPAMKQKIEKLREIINAEDKILDIKIWAANEMLDMGEEGKKVAEEMISKNEDGAYVVRKEMGNRR